MTTLRPYQQQAIKSVKELFEQSSIKEVVLAMCPGSGKTFTSCSLIKELNCRTLILTHGTSVLRSQWKDRLSEYGIDYSTDIHSDSQVVMNLPQSIYKEVGFKSFDLVIVDEAHEFYLADMVQSIISKSGTPKVLLLTGTPSKFIRSKTPMVTVSAEDILNLPDSDKFISDVYFGIAETEEVLKYSDFSSDGNLKEGVAIKNVKNSLDNLVDSVATRLSQITGASAVGDAFQAFQSIGKTLIACNNIDQSVEVFNYLTSKSIKCVVSNSDNDPDSEGIELFKTDHDVQVLIVVNRGVLGFDFVDLHNVVDMTLSKNIDRMYQLYARVMRPKAGVRKLFFKVVPSAQSDMYKFYMTASISLLRTDIISKYDGTNLTSLKIPTVRAESEPRNPSQSRESSVSNRACNKPLEMLFNGQVPVADIMIKTNSKVGSMTEIAYVTLSELKHNEFGRRPRILGIDEYTLVKYLQTGELDPIVYTEDWNTGKEPVLIETLTTSFGGVYDREIPFKIKSRGKDLDHSVQTYFSKYNTHLLDKWLPRKLDTKDLIMDLYNSDPTNFPIDCLTDLQRSVIVEMVYNGKSIGEAAKVLPTGCVSTASVSAKLGLKKMIEYSKARAFIKSAEAPKRVVQYYVENMSQTEIATLEGVSHTAINRTISKWRKDNGI